MRLNGLAVTVPVLLHGLRLHGLRMRVRVRRHRLTVAVVHRSGPNLHLSNPNLHGLGQVPHRLHGLHGKGLVPHVMRMRVRSLTAVRELLGNVSVLMVTVDTLHPVRSRLPLPTSTAPRARRRAGLAERSSRVVACSAAIARSGMDGVPRAAAATVAAEGHEFTGLTHELVGIAQLRRISVNLLHVLHPVLHPVLRLLLRMLLKRPGPGVALRGALNRCIELRARHQHGGRLKRLLSAMSAFAHLLSVLPGTGEALRAVEATALL